MFARKLYCFLQIASLSYACKQFVANLYILSIANRCKPNCLLQLQCVPLLGQNMLVEGCELSTTFWFASYKFPTTGCIKEMAPIGWQSVC